MKSPEITSLLEPQESRFFDGAKRKFLAETIRNFTLEAANNVRKVFSLMKSETDK